MEAFIQRMIYQIEQNAPKANAQDPETNPKQTQGCPGRYWILGSKRDLNFFGTSHEYDRTGSMAQGNLPATVMQANVGKR